MIEKKWQSAIDTIANDNLSGSTDIAKKALSVLREFYIENPDCNHDYLMETAETIKKAKPSMAAPKNIIDGVISLIGNGNGEQSFARVICSLTEATNDTVAAALSELMPFDSVLTCSYSVTVIEIIKQLKSLLPGIKILALESEFGGIKYGNNLNEAFNKLNIDCSLYPDSMGDKAVREANCFLTGADSVIEGLGAVNGSPTLMLAQKAFGKIPYYIAAESFKKSANITIQHGFDFVPAQYITKIFSDEIFPFHPKNM